ncbi:methyltransferase domain-containing protein [Ramlibacter humi]|uniref:Methyltransferase domain-containing protein n=1 Tax=Ramlibacter humi TaxID=2530451 RepID=A0A4Z0BG59_9BURK|nr:methyltransferase domain-containing protein [Ramlibacter humi]TFY98305.1 methyltransferase domain-containing protein [Ramlibacter humi]
MDATFEQAKAFFLQGLAHYQAGRWAAAERAFAASLALVPGRPSTLTNLGATVLKLGRAEEAAELLQEALAQEPDNAEALAQLSAALAELGRAQPALECVIRSLSIDARNAAAWTLRGTLEREAGRREAAASSFRRALETGADASLVNYYLAGVSGADAPAAPPRGYVEQLFDSYADGFEQHLAGALQYRGPEILVAGLSRDRYGAALDLGCGTGLAAPLLRPLCERLTGVDLSANMVQRARAGGLYDEVRQGEAVEVLSSMPAASLDLVLAADVFIYVGALEAVFAQAARVLRPGGEFSFSVEQADEPHAFELRMSLRYAHSERYIRTLAGQCGFELHAVQRHPLRIDQGQPVAGLFAWLRRNG